ncbi:hypothetical protein [Candidatus Magnetominusculus dajiuhuensis]|uniref:hypothetical protein n=1 Tax=Candidatus Magnetominusculus dajiuhuensis TaxID=3137712 RepID=UPI003B4328A4
MDVLFLKKKGHNLLRAFANTLEMEKVLEGYLCPLQMFIELTENGLNSGAFKILKHDLTAKRIFLTRVALKYLRNIALSVETPPTPIHGNSELTPSGSNTHIQPAQPLHLWENIISIPLFIYGVIYAIARAISRGSLKTGDKQ